MSQVAIEGRFDGFVGNNAYGWAWRRGQAEHRLGVNLLVDGEIVAEMRADTLRNDLLEHGIGDGRHGFQFQLEPSLLDGRVHTISVKDAETGGDLVYSPRQFCSSPYVDAEKLFADAPWVDQPDADERIREKFNAGQISFSDAKLLTFWRENGYILIPNAIDPELIDYCNRDIDEMLARRLPVHFVSPGIDPTPFSEVKHEGSFVSCRFLEFHTVSQAALQLSMHPDVIRFLQTVFEDTPVCMQSLLFIGGTQQRAHLDYPYVHTPKPAYLAASWIPLEDVHPDAGPLFYYPKSHRTIRPFDFGFGNVLAHSDGYHVRDFEEYLERQCQELELERKLLTVKKGDLLVWHYHLVHGGSEVADPARTRRSLVTHFSSRSVYATDRRYPNDPPIARAVNGGVYYDFKPGTYPTKLLGWQ